MIDRRKLVTIGTAALAVVAVFIVAIVWMIRSDSSTAPHSSMTATSARPTHTPSSSSTPTEAPTPTDGAGGSPETTGAYAVVGDAQRFGKAATKAAIAAATWDGTNTAGYLRKQYLAGGFTPKLAASFKPVWARVFNSPKVFHYKDSGGRTDLTATVTPANEGAEPAYNSSTGKAGHRQFRFGVLLSYTANWSQKTGSDSYQQEGSDTWWVTVDEATGKAVAIQQPSQTDIGFRIN